jgi:hypothetical protein
MMILNWQYKGWTAYPTTNPDAQIDWNQTLMATINWAARLNVEQPSKIEVPTKYKQLVETLAFYKDGKINNEFDVVFHEKDDLFSIGETKIQVVGYNEGN